MWNRSKRGLQRGDAFGVLGVWPAAWVAADRAPRLKWLEFRAWAGDARLPCQAGRLGEWKSLIARPGIRILASWKHLEGCFLCPFPHLDLRSWDADLGYHRSAHWR